MLADRQEVAAEVLLLLAEACELVADDLERRAPGEQRARRRVEEALLGEVERLLGGDYLGVVLGVGDEEALVHARGVLERAVLLRDLLRARNAGGEVAERLGILLHGLEELLPFGQLRLLRLERENVRSGLGKPLLDRVAGRPEAVDLVRGAEVDDLLREAVDVAALVLDVLVRVLNRLVALHAVLLVGERLDRLGVGVCERGGEARILRAHGYRDDSRVALELELRVRERRDDVVVRNGRGGMGRPVLLLDHQHDLIGAPVGDSRVEYLGVVLPEVLYHVLHRARAARHAAHVHGELALRLVDRRGDAVDGERDDEPDEQEHEHGKPALGDDAERAAQGDGADD